MLSFTEILCLMCAGSFGTLFRYLLTVVYTKIPFTNSITIINGISIVNLVGCFLFAVVYGYFMRHALPYSMQSIFLTGFLGAFTTFSTLMFETRQLFVDNMLLGIIYLLIQIIIGFIVVHFTLDYFNL